MRFSHFLLCLVILCVVLSAQRYGLILNVKKNPVFFLSFLPHFYQRRNTFGIKTEEPTDPSVFINYLIIYHFENITFSLLNMRVRIQTPRMAYRQFDIKVMRRAIVLASWAKTCDMESTLL